MTGGWMVKGDSRGSGVLTAAGRTFRVVVVACFVLGLSFPGSGMSAEPKCGKATYHKVVSGDTLWGLAQRYETTVKELQRMNGAKAKNLQPGTRLVVKAAKKCAKPKPKKKTPAAAPEPAPEPTQVDEKTASATAAEPTQVDEKTASATAAEHTQVDEKAVFGAVPEITQVDEIRLAGVYDEAAEIGDDDCDYVPWDDEDGRGLADAEDDSEGVDPYSGDGIPDDVVELPDFAEFGFTDDGSACASYLEALTPMPKKPKGTVNIYHKVKKGDNLIKIARKYKTTVKNLESLNGLRRKPAKLKKLMHPGKLVLIRLGDPADLLAARPYLADWVHLKAQKGYTVKRSSTAYGRPFALRLMLRSICEFRRRNPDAGSIVVGDWSGRVGGQLSRHLSHKTGRDVDLSYFIKGRPNLKGFAKATPSNIDVELSWELVRALLDSGQIEYIFMDHKLQRVLYNHALKKGFPQADLDQIFQYPAPRSSRSGIIRWAKGHDDHIHVRFRCPKNDCMCR